MKSSITIRMYLKSFREIKRVFPAKRQETMTSYFERLAEWLKRGENKYYMGADLAYIKKNWKEDES